MKAPLKTLALAAVAAMLAGCGGRGVTAPVTPQAFAAPAAANGAVRTASDFNSNACPNGEALFVPNFDIDTVSVLDAATGSLRTTLVAGGLSGPAGAAYNPANKVLYVTNWWTTTLSLFNATTGAPLGVIANANLVGPYGAAVGPDGKLYVANNGSTTVSIVDTAHNNAILAPITGLNGPGGVAVANNRVYVSNMFGNSVSIFDSSKNNAPVATINGLHSPFGVAVVGTRLYVANESNNTISVFDTGSLNSVATLQGNSLNMPFGLASDNATVFAVDAPTSTISKFTAGNFAAAGTLSGAGTGMKSPYGAAIGCSPPIPSSPPAPPADCPNAIYVANYGSNNIAILDASTHAQLGTISGSGVNGPVSVAYDRIKQQLYVGNWNDDTVGVFNAATNVKMGILSGNGIDAPYGVGVGNEGRLYVANLDAQGGKGISRFDTNNQFAALPALTSTPYAGGIAVGVNKVFASNYFNNTIAIFDPTNNDAYIGSISGNGLNKPFGLAAVGLNVYAANNGANTLSEFDQTTLGFVRTVSGNSLNSPYGMAFNATDMFAANGNSTISDFSATSGAAFGVLAGSSINQTYGVAAGRSCGVLKKTMDFRRSLGNAKAPLLEREISSHGFAASATSGSDASDLTHVVRREARHAMGPASFLRQAAGSQQP